ncbi:signal peptidase I, partial [Acinetobacter baumannii]|nr:signal peptidase I [Acinetobacter baumannii]
MVDNHDKSYEIGDMINFTMDRDVRFIKPGDKVIKIVAGKGGDKIQITETFVKNGERIFPVDGRRIAKKYQIDSQTLN